MLRNISWNNYIVVVVLLTVVWYLFVAFRYYYSDIIDFINRKRILQIRVVDEELIEDSYEDSSFDKSAKEISTESYLEASDNISEEIEIFTTKLKEGIAVATHKEFKQESFQDYMQSFLAEFSTLRNSSLRNSIIELIVSECEKNESTLLTHEQVDDLWK